MRKSRCSIVMWNQRLMKNSIANSRELCPNPSNREKPHPKHSTSNLPPFAVEFNPTTATLLSILNAFNLRFFHVAINRYYRLLSMLKKDENCGHSQRKRIG